MSTEPLNLVEFLSMETKAETTTLISQYFVHGKNNNINFSITKVMTVQYYLIYVYKGGWIGR